MKTMKTIKINENPWFEYSSMRWLQCFLPGPGFGVSSPSSAWPAYPWKSMKIDEHHGNQRKSMNVNENQGKALLSFAVCTITLCTARLCTTRLCTTRLCTATLCATKLCTAKLCTTRLCTARSRPGPWPRPGPGSRPGPGLAQALARVRPRP